MMDIARQVQCTMCSSVSAGEVINDDFLFYRFADTSVVSSLVLYKKSVSDIQLWYPLIDGSMAPLGRYAGKVVVLPYLSLLRFSAAEAYEPPTVENFREHFLGIGLTPADFGVVSFRSSLDYRKLSRFVMDDIWDEGSPVESKKMRQRRTEDFSGVSFDVMVNAEVYSAGASLLTRDFKYARRYGYWFRQLGAPVYGVKFG